jgi:hypothetical protein
MGVPAGVAITGVEMRVVGNSSVTGFYFQAYAGSGSSIVQIGVTSGGVGNTPFATAPSNVTMVGGQNVQPVVSLGSQLTVAQWNSGTVELQNFLTTGPGSGTYPYTFSIDTVQLRVHYEIPIVDGPNSPTSAVSAGGTTMVWSNPTNVFASDDNKASLTFNGSTATTASNIASLNITGFGFNIPAGATIQYITAEIEMSRNGTGSSGEARTANVQLMKAGAATGTNKSTTTNLGTVDAYRSYGGDLWGTTWTPAQINASNFGISIRPAGSTAATNRTITVDHVRITVAYTGVVGFSYTNTGTGTQSYTLTVPSAPEPSVDPYWANVWALLHFDGADDSSTIFDQTGRSWSASGNTFLGTSGKKFGTAAVNFPGDTSSFISTPVAPNIGLQAVTFETWIKTSQVSSSGYAQIWDNARPGGTGDFGKSWQIYLHDGKLSLYIGESFSGGIIDIEQPTPINDGQWHHIVVQRDTQANQGHWHCFIDGVGHPNYVPNDNTDLNYVGQLAMGVWQGGPGDPFQGQLDDMRITVGTARYPQEGFTPPTAPFPNGEPAPANPQFSYSITGAGTQSYTLSAKTSLAYSITGTGAQAYSLAAKTSLAYANSGTGTQSYALSAKAALAYSITGTGSQAYVLGAKTSLTYLNTGTGTNSYSLGAKTSLAYTNTGTGTQTYTLSGTVLADPQFSYSITGTGAQTYVLKAKTALAYVNTGTGTQSYALSAKTSLAYVNTGTGTQAYTLTVQGVDQPKPDVGSWSGKNKGRHINQSAKLVKPEEPKATALKPAKKAFKADQAAIDALKSGIKVEAKVDPRIAEGIEAARLIAEFEAQAAEELRLQIIEEDELILLMITQATNRRQSNPFERLLT